MCSACDLVGHAAIQKINFLITFLNSFPVNILFKMGVVYEPREDSYLIAKQIGKYIKGKDKRVLEIGTGTGFLAIEASKFVKSVLAVDINGRAVQKARTATKGHKNIRVKKSDLFSDIVGKYDFVIFNPPYLPNDPKIKDVALDGGKRGYEVIERFMSAVGDHLTPKGKILLLFSSLTGKDTVNIIIEKHFFKKAQVAKKKMDFEELYVYLIEKTDLLKKLEEKKLKGIIPFTQGKRGMIYTAKIGKKKVAIKVQRKDTEARQAVNNEAKTLKALKKYGIGVNLIFSGKDFFVYDYVEGDFILKFFEKAEYKQIKKILITLYEQLYKLDRLKLNKEEMHHPDKHVIIKGTKPIMLDFERCKKVSRPKNVTQFCQYLISANVRELLKSKGVNVDQIQMLMLAKRYKDNSSKKSLNDIIDFLFS